MVACQLKRGHRKIRQGSWEPRERVQRMGHREPEEKRNRAGRATEKPLRRAGRNEWSVSDQVLKQAFPLEEDNRTEQSTRDPRSKESAGAEIGHRWVKT